VVACAPDAARLSYLRGAVTRPARRITRVLLVPAAAASITAEAARSSDGNETGGIVLGRVHADGTAQVRCAGGPGPAAVRTPVFFLRDLGHARRIAAAEYARSGSVWIGDWHTHLRSGPVPSSRDMLTYGDLLTDRDLDFDAFLALIVCSGPLGWTRSQICGWACQDEQAVPVPVSVCEDLERPGPPG
jgi:integrative and conjugative element protein (TIGR02256 family)